MSVEFQDYYKVLGVERGDDQQTIQKAYKKLARKYHPDINPDKKAEEKFKQIGEAYQVLKDPETRAKYDQLGANWKSGQPFTPPGGWGRGAPGGGSVEFGGDFSEFFNAIFGGSARGRGGPFGGGGFGGGRRAHMARRGQDLETEVSVTLEEMYHGTRKEISLTVRSTDPMGQVSRETKNLKVTIPSGTLDGAVLRLAGQGGQGSGGGPAGDIRLTLKVAPHPDYSLDGANLTVKVPITPWEAALGATVEVPTLDGPVAMKVPPGIQGAQKLRLKGKGLPRKDRPGDLFVKIQIAIPKELTHDEKTLFESLQKVSDFQPRAPK